MHLNLDINSFLIGFATAVPWFGFGLFAVMTFIISGPDDKRWLYVWTSKRLENMDKKPFPGISIMAVGLIIACIFGPISWAIIELLVRACEKMTRLRKRAAVK